jgi:RNA polymerase-interacting CarD/CdnL/TRCF family regulator
MNVQENTFTRGDWIVHAFYGVGQVRDLENKKLDGEKQDYYRVKTFNGEYWLSTTRTEVEHIRPITSEYKINRALRMIRDTPEKMPENHTERSKVISEAIKDPSLYTKACMIRDLHGKEQESKLNFSEEDAFLKMRKQFLDEWSVIKDVDREILEEKLDQALSASS